MSRLRKFYSLLMVVVLLVAAQLSAPVPAQAGGCTVAHVVRPAENLFRIGLVYGYAWTVLQRYNACKRRLRAYKRGTLDEPKSVC
jgi:hypothetical protein